MRFQEKPGGRGPARCAGEEWEMKAARQAGSGAPGPQVREVTCSFLSGSQRVQGLRLPFRGLPLSCQATGLPGPESASPELAQDCPGRSQQYQVDG